MSGKQYLDESNYDKAISYFSDAYSIDCSVHAILPIIATAYERKGDKAEAVRALEEYLRRVPTSPDREHVERRIKNLNDQLAREQPSAAPTPTASSSATAVAPVPTVAPPASSTPTVGPAPTTDSSSTTSVGPGPWILTGVGGAAVIGGIVLYAVGASDISSAEEACHGSRVNCPSSAASTGNSGRTLETVGAVVGVAGVVSLGAGLAWLFTAKPSSAPPSGGAFMVTPVLAPGYAGITLGSPL